MASKAEPECRFTVGQKVYRHCTVEPAYIYGGDRMTERGEVIGTPLEYEGKWYVPVKWQYSPHPDLASAFSVRLQEG